MKRFLFILILSFFAIVCFATIVMFFRKANDKNELTLYGNVDVRLVDIGFRVAGNVNQLFFEEGDWVEKGKLMAILDKSPYDSQVLQAEANVEAIAATYLNAQKLLKRRQELIGVGGVSQAVGKEFANADPGGKLPEHKAAKRKKMYPKST